MILHKANTLSGSQLLEVRENLAFHLSDSNDYCLIIQFIKQ